MMSRLQIIRLFSVSLNQIRLFFDELTSLSQFQASLVLNNISRLTICLIKYLFSFQTIV